MDSSAFKDQLKKDGSGKREVLFNNGKRDGGERGHVVWSTDEHGNRTYQYARDVEGNVYVDDSRARPVDSNRNDERSR
jgi:hypothetical protein